MQHIKLQPGIGLAEIQDIINMIPDKDGTALKSFLKGELVLNKVVWHQLINLKFGVTINQDEKITKQLEEGIYGRNAKSPEEEAYLRNFSLSDFYMVSQAATAYGIIINSPSIDRMLTEKKNSKNRQDELLQEHLSSKVVEEMCLPLMKDDWEEKSFKPTQQLAVTVVYFMRKNLFKEASVESIADEFKLTKQQLYKLVTGKKLKSGKVAK